MAKARFNIGLSAQEVEAVMMQAHQCLVEERGGVLKDEAITRNNIQSVSRWLTNKEGKPFLLIQGNVGNGKTTMAKCIASTVSIIRYHATEIMRRDRWKMTTDELHTYLPLSELPDVEIMTARKIVSLAGKEEEFRRIERCRLLIIDDLGVEPTTAKIYGTEITPLVDILYSRYDALLPTIITTNLNDAEIKELYKERISDRLEEICDKLIYYASSYRGNTNKNE